MRTFGNRPRELLTNVLSAQGRIDGSLLSNDFFSITLLPCRFLTVFQFNI